MLISFVKRMYLSLKSDNEFTEIVIEDDGPGYPYDIISKIGEPFKNFKEN